MTTDSPSPVGIVLAAGKSSRMGRPKQLLPWGESTVIEEIVASVSAKFAQTIVVLGHRAAHIGQLLARFGIEIVVNHDYERGMLSSVKCGLSAVSKSSAFAIFLGDQPVIESEVIDTIQEAQMRTGIGIIVPTFREKRGHPVLLAARYRKDILMLADDGGLNKVTRGHPKDTLEVPVAAAAILEDFDTPRDYQRVLAEFGRSNDG